MKYLRILLFVLLSPLAFGQTWTGILAPARAMDWSLAGSAHINDARTQCVAAACNTVSGGTVTAASITSALAAAGYNQFVLIPAGTFTISGVIKYPQGGSGLTTCTSNCSNITLRGSGASSTLLTISGASTCTEGGQTAICMESSDVNYMGGPTNTANWTAGYTQGSSSITLSAVTNLKVGWPIVLDQLDDASDSGALWVDCENSALCGVNGPSGFQRTGRAQFQMVNVASCTTASGAGDTVFGHACTSGTGITTSEPLYAPNWRTGQTPGAWWPTSPIFNDGLENLSATYNGGVGVTIFNCTGCWVKGVRGVRTATTPTGWFHVGSFISNHTTVKDNYFFGFPGDSYVAGPQVASDMLIENNISQKPAGFVYNSDCEGCVLAYNFSVDAGANAAAFLSQSHWYHSIVMYALDEGNIGAGLYADLFHGNHDMNTTFRNRWQGIGIDSTGTLTNSGNNALIITYGSRYNNFVGNIMGMPGYHNGYQTGTQNVVDVDTTDANITPSTLFWGNWNAGSSANLFCTAASTPIASCPRDERAGSATTFPGLASPSATLPASFYYSAKPSWWPTGKAWPIIGPDITGGNVGVCPSGTFQFSDVITSVTNVCGAGITPSTLASGEVISNPAMDCYFNVMGGNANGTNGPLTFNAASCYAAIPQVATPTFSPVAGTYGTAQTVTVTSSTASAVICYTVDGSTPVGNGSGSCTVGTTLANGGAVSVSTSETIQALGTLSGDTDSAVGSATYTIGTPVASLTPSSLSFGGVNNSNTSAPQTLTLQNTGTAVMSITSISLAGANTGDFFQSNNCPVGSNLGNGASCTITVTFTPLAVGSRAASVSVADGASGSPHTSALSGTGVQASISCKGSPGAKISGRASVK